MTTNKHWSLKKSTGPAGTFYLVTCKTECGVLAASYSATDGVSRDNIAFRLRSIKQELRAAAEAG